MILDEVDRNAIPVLACHWLKINAKRYNYVGDDAKRLLVRVSVEAPDSEAAKENYLSFLKLFEYNYSSNGSAIYSDDFACFFVINQHKMYIPVELYCQTAGRVRGTEFKSAVARLNCLLADVSAHTLSPFNDVKRKWQYTLDQILKNSDLRQWIKSEYVKRYTERVECKGEDFSDEKYKPKGKTAFVGLILIILMVLMIADFIAKVRINNNMSVAVMFVFLLLVTIIAVVIGPVFQELKAAFYKRKINRDCLYLIKYIEELNSIMARITENKLQIEEKLRSYMEAYGSGQNVDTKIVLGWHVQGSDKDLSKSDKILERITVDMKSEKPLLKKIKMHHILLFAVMFFVLLVDWTYREEMGGSLLLEIVSLSVKQGESSTVVQETIAETEEVTARSMWYTSAPQCNVRTEPWGDVVTTLLAGTEIEVSDSQRDSQGLLWLKVSTGSVSGWVSRKVVREVNPNEISITGVSATSELVTKNSGTMRAGYAVDGDLLTSWQEGVAGYGEGQQLRIEFDGEQSVNAVRIVNGNVRGQDGYAENGRLKKVSITSDGGETELFDLIDEYNYIEGALLEFENPILTSSLTFTIEEVYPGTRYEDTCITEITAYGTRTAD